MADSGANLRLNRRKLSRRTMHNPKVPKLTRPIVRSRWLNTVATLGVALCALLGVPSDARAANLIVECGAAPIIQPYSKQCDNGNNHALAWALPGLRQGVFASVEQLTTVYNFAAFAQVQTGETFHFTQPGFVQFGFELDGVFVGGVFTDPPFSNV